MDIVKYMKPRRSLKISEDISEKLLRSIYDTLQSVYGNMKKVKERKLERKVRAYEK